MKRRTSPPKVDLGHVPEVELPSGKRLTEGREFHVPRVGRFSFRYGTRCGSVTAFGPLHDDGRPKPKARLRSFRPDRISTVHNLKGAPK